MMMVIVCDRTVRNQHDKNVHDNRTVVMIMVVVAVVVVIWTMAQMR